MAEDGDVRTNQILALYEQLDRCLRLANAIDDESIVRGWQAVASSYPEFHEHLDILTRS